MDRAGRERLGGVNIRATLAHLTKKAIPVLVSLLIILACLPPTLGPSLKGDGVVFRLQIPQAQSICIVGDFNSWEHGKDCLQYLPNEGIWQITLPLKRGTYQYMFIIDHKKWIPDPQAQAYADDGFGNKNSLLIYR